MWIDEKVTLVCLGIPRIPRDLPVCNSFPTSAIVLDPYCPWEHKVVGAGQVP